MTKGRVVVRRGRLLKKRQLLKEKAILKQKASSPCPDNPPVL
jgi:hypothetical protein